MGQMRAWKFRPGSDDKTVRDTLKTGIIRLDYEVPSLRPSFASQVALVQAAILRRPKRAGRREDENSAIGADGDDRILGRDRFEAFLDAESFADEAAQIGSKPQRPTIGRDNSCGGPHAQRLRLFLGRKLLLDPARRPHKAKRSLLSARC